MSKQIVNPQSPAVPVKAGQKQIVKIAKGQHLRVQELVDGALKDAANVVATKAGKDLKLKFADGTEIGFENFYEECAGNGCSVTLAGKEAGGYTITGDTAVGAAAQGDSQLVYAYGEQTSLMAMAGGDSAIGAALAPLGEGTVAYVPAAQGTGWAPLLGAMAGLGAAAGAGGGGGGAAASMVPILIKGSFVAGPVVANNGLEAKAYGANGQLLATGVLASDGTFGLDLGQYTGAVLVVVADKDSGADYWDEATGAPKDLSVDMLRAATFAPAGGTIHVNVNVFTEAAVRLLGANGVNLPAGASAATIAAANKKVTDALGLQQDIVAGTAPVAVVTATGAPNLDANTYGKLLAAASGVDESGNTERTIEMLLAAVQDQVNPVLVTAALLLQGAANVVDKVPGFLTQAQMSLNDYFFIADTVHKLRVELAGGLKAGDYATIKALSDAVKALEAAVGEDGPFATALASLQAQITILVETTITNLQAQIDAIHGNGSLVENLSTLAELGNAVKALQDAMGGEGGLGDRPAARPDARAMPRSSGSRPPAIPPHGRGRQAPGRACWRCARPQARHSTPRARGRPLARYPARASRPGSCRSPTRPLCRARRGRASRDAWPWSRRA